MLENVSNPCF